MFAAEAARCPRVTTALKLIPLQKDWDDTEMSLALGLLWVLLCQKECLVKV